MNPQLLALIIKELPNIVAGFKALFKKNNPGLPDPTSEQVIMGFNLAYSSSIVKDDAWLAAHPPGGTLPVEPNG